MISRRPVYFNEPAWSDEGLGLTCTRPKTYGLCLSQVGRPNGLFRPLIRKDMRSFAIVDDAGFREIAQRCVSIGNFIFY